MITKQDSDFEPLAVACAQTNTPYMVAWRLATSGKVATKRDGRGKWYVRPSDLRALLALVTVGGPQAA